MRLWKGESELVEVAIHMRKAIGTTSRIFLSCPEERCEYFLRVFEIIVHNVDEIRVVHNIHDEEPWWCTSIVYVGPFHTQFICLILQCITEYRNFQFITDGPPSTP